jgi:hypothetical protein
MRYEFGKAISLKHRVVSLKNSNMLQIREPNLDVVVQTGAG